VLQALGSKGEERAKRRKQKKDSYAEYLESDVWKKIRARVLKRDKNKCLGCGKRAYAVHHRRYPRNLGQERLDWLYSVCAECHSAIHRAAAAMPLRKATDLIITTRPPRTIRLPDDPRLSQREARRRQQPKKRKARKVRSKHVSGSSKKAKLIAENERLHEELRRNRERRESARSDTDWAMKSPWPSPLDARGSFSPPEAPPAAPEQFVLRR
jgi:hypothetical protein